MYKYKNENILWILTILTSISDLITTYIGLENNLIEKNEIANYMLINYGFYSLIFIKFSIIVVCYFLNQKLTYGKYKYISPSILSITWLIATINNIYLIFYIF